MIFVHTDPDSCDENCGGACQRFFEAEEEVFTREKILLGLRAFRPIQMWPEHARAEPLLADTGPEALPRLIILDVARGEFESLHSSRLTASSVYSAMKKAASRFYRERLDGRVKKHQKLLGQHDKLAQELNRLQEQAATTGDDRRADKLEDQLQEVREQQDELDRKIENLWDLTLRAL